jgi:hypothetical protein
MKRKLLFVDLFVIIRSKGSAYVPQWRKYVRWKVKMWLRKAPCRIGSVGFSVETAAS